MGFFSKLFGLGKTSAAPAVVERRRPDTGIAYDPALVPKLKSDHQDLLTMFGKISQTAEMKQYEELPKLLKKFKLALQTHLITENVRFYAYTQQRHINDNHSSDLIAGLRKEMNGIASAAIQFINRYETELFTPDVAVQFSKDLAGIGEVLVQRINTEEASLYTLYVPK